MACCFLCRLKEWPPCPLGSWFDQGSAAWKEKKVTGDVRFKHCDMHLRGAWLTPAVPALAHRKP